MVLFCCNAYPPRFIGGAELIAHQHAIALYSAGHEVAVFAGEGHPIGPHYSVRQDRLDGIPIHRIQLAGRDFAADHVCFQHRQVDDAFSRLLDRYSPSVVHFHNIIGLSAGMIGRAKQHGCTVVVTLHDHWGYCYKNTIIKREAEICRDFRRCSECMPNIPDDSHRNMPIRMRSDYLAYRLSQVDAFISPSHFLAASYLRAGIPLQKMRVIWNGVDVDRFASIGKSARNGRVRFTYIGYLGEHKGVPSLLEAGAYLGDPKNYQINVVGEGHLRESLEHQAKKLHFATSLRFWGKVDNRRIDTVFHETDVLILPSIWPENQPVSITEGMATRTPVIASDTGGIPELVSDEVSGYLYPAGNSQQLADRMQRFIDSPSEIDRLGAAGFERIRDITFPNQAKKLLETYREAGAKI